MTQSDSDTKTAVFAAILIAFALIVMRDGNDSPNVVPTSPAPTYQLANPTPGTAGGYAVASPDAGAVSAAFLNRVIGSNPSTTGGVDGL